MQGLPRAVSCSTSRIFADSVERAARLFRSGYPLGKPVRTLRWFCRPRVAQAGRPSFGACSTPRRTGGSPVRQRIPAGRARANTTTDWRRAWPVALKVMCHAHPPAMDPAVTLVVRQGRIAMCGDIVKLQLHVGIEKPVETEGTIMQNSTVESFIV